MPGRMPGARMHDFKAGFLSWLAKQHKYISIAHFKNVPQWLAIGTILNIVFIPFCLSLVLFATESGNQDFTIRPSLQNLQRQILFCILSY